jgi:cytochrome c556
VKKSAITALVVATLASAFHLAPAHAQFAKAEDAVKYRQSTMFLMNNHMGRLAAMSRGTVPFDAAAAQSSARLIESLSHIAWEAYTPNSITDRSRAKPEIWQDAAKFSKAHDAMMAETLKLPAAVATLDGLKAQVGAVGRACKACHDDFRKD